MASSTGRLTEVTQYTPLYARYSGAVHLWYIFVQPEQLAQAQAVLKKTQELPA